MEKKRRMQVLDDELLNAVTGGTGTKDMKVVMLDTLTNDQMAYYLQGLCPFCQGALTTESGGDFGCENARCRILFRRP